MSQHDLNIANQGFPAFRSDLNNALVALGTNASGATAPATTFAHQFWMDTAANPSILKVRNADNDAWITLGTFNQTADTFTPAGVTSDKIEEGNSKVEVVDTGTGYIVFEVDGAEVARFNPDQLVTKAGTASTPAISPTGDLNTGIFFPAADTIAFAEGGAEAMRIDSSGNVGIGTSSPQSRLHVSDPVSGGQLLVTSNETNSSSKIGSLATMSYTNTEEPVLAISVEGSSADNLVQIGGGPGEFNAATQVRFFTAANTTTTGGTERMRIDSGGNLSLGGLQLSSGRFCIRGDTNARIQSAIVENANAGSSSRCGYIVNAFGNSWAMEMGSMAANSNTLNWTVDMFGTPTVRMALTTGGAATNSTGSWGTISDLRLKENVVDATPKLDGLMQLRVVNYNLKTDPEIKMLGFVAQEVEQVFPGLVDDDGEATEDGDRYKSVKTTVLIPMLVKAIQEQQAIIEQLKTRIETLEAKVSALEANNS